MDRRLPWALIATWLVLGVINVVAFPLVLDGRSSSLSTTLTVEAVVIWAATWVAMLVPRGSTLTAARIGVPGALFAGFGLLLAGGSTAWSCAAIVAAIIALAVLSLPVTIDAFIDGSSYGPEQRFALRTPVLAALVATPLTWVVVALIGIVLPLAAAGKLIPALILGVVWVAGFRWAVRSLHLPSRRWVVFVPAGMVLSDPLSLTDRVLFPRRNVAAIGPAFADTDATDLSVGTRGLATQVDLTEPFAMPMIDRGVPDDGATWSHGPGSAPGERIVNTDRIVFAALRPGALLEAAASRRFAVGATLAQEPSCMHHAGETAHGGHAHDHDHSSESPAEVSQTAVPLPKTRSSS